MPSPSDGTPSRDLDAERLAVIRTARATAELEAAGNAHDYTLRVRCPNCHNTIQVAPGDDNPEISCGSCGHSFSLLAEDGQTRHAEPVRTVGHFDLVELLGSGGSGTVWKAYDRELDRTVAVKIPRTAQLDPAATEQFLREARTAAQLRHPNIVTVHEVGREDNTVYIVTDLIRGVSLSNWLCDALPAVPDAVRLISQIARVLHYAHEEGIVHRDLKPQNVMIDTEGRPYLMDFGLARRDSGDLTVTCDGQVLGTPAYMSPEQAQGRSHSADRRSDIYSLGVILFQALTGELPFRGNAQMLIYKVANEEAPSPRRFNGSLPKDLETICLKCLEKSPQRRYSTALEVADELDLFLQGKPIHARPIGAAGRTWRWCKRNPEVASLIAMVIVAVGLGGSVSTYFAVESSKKAVEVEAARRVEYHDLLGKVDLVRTARTEGFRPQAWQWLARAAALQTPDVDRDELRKKAVACLGDFVGFKPLVLDQFPARLRAIAFHDPSETLAIAFDSGHVWLVDAKTGRRTSVVETALSAILAIGCRGTELEIVAVDAQQGVVTWRKTSDGLWNEQSRHALLAPADRADISSVGLVAVHSTGQIGVYEIGGGVQLTQITSPPNLDLRSVAIAPDGKALCAGYTTKARDDSGLLFWALPSGEFLEKVTLHVGDPYPRSVAFSADSKLVAIGAEGLFTFQSPGFRQRTLMRGDAIKAVAYSSDRQWLAVVHIRGSVSLFSVTSNQEVALLMHPRKSAGGEAICFGANDRYLISSKFDSVRIWDLHGSGEKRSIPGHDGGVPTVAFARDASLLVSGAKDGVIRFWRPASGEPHGVLPGEHGAIQSIDVSTSGRYLAVADWSGSGRLEVWDLSARKRIAVVPHELVAISCVRFSPDEKYLAAVGDGMQIWKIGETAEANGSPIELLPVSHEPGKFSLHLEFSPDSRRLAWADNWYDVRLWDVGGARPLPLQGATMQMGWHGLMFFPDSRRIIFVGKTGAAEVWDLVRGELESIVGAAKTFQSPHLALSADGHWLAAVTAPRVVSIWDVDVNRELFALRAERSDIWSLAWSSDRRYLSVGLADGGLSVWDFAKIRLEVDKLGLAWDELPVRAALR